MPRRRSLIFVTVVVVFSLFLLVNFIQKIYIVPLIMYHSVNAKVRPKMELLIVTPQTFEKQMRFLKEWHYNVLPLESVAELIRNKKKIPARTVAVTFDDGYRDNYTYAFPILKKYNLPATIFIIVNEVDLPDRLTWEEIKVMRDSGLITFGSHALDAQPLTEIKLRVDLKKQILRLIAI